VARRAVHVHLQSYLYKHGINRCVQNRTALKCAKNHGNWFRRLEDVSRISEPLNVVAPFFGPLCISYDFTIICSVAAYDSSMQKAGIGTRGTGTRATMRDPMYSTTYDCKRFLNEHI